MIWILIIYLVGCVLAWGRLRAINVAKGYSTNMAWGLSFLSWSILPRLIHESWGSIFVVRDPKKLARKREMKRLREEEIDKRIAANTFDFNSRPIPEMYSWMQ